ncbi:hypothetical protein ACIBG8_53785 [Nonomuraea sp. NPDC050556]|uniref:hypothetical protein n=1 Tax=Nonomuraea sp. NPDC050556 TaxID=3364369 RepID=UPI0037A51A55
MSFGDDLDERFNALVAQFDEGEQRRMREAASKAAKQHDKQARKREPRRRRDDYTARPRMSERRWKVWLAVWLVIAIVAASGAIVAVRPDLLSP